LKKKMPNKGAKKKQKRSLEPQLFMARLAEQADRFPDMFNFLEEAVKNRVDPPHFTIEERNLLSHSFKNLITPKRQTWRHLVSQATGSDQNYTNS